MKQLILAFILIFNLNIALSESSKDSLSKDVLNVTLVGELNKNLYDTYTYSFKTGYGLGIEFELHLAKNSALNLIYHNQQWLESTKLRTSSLNNNRELHKGENQKIGLTYSYIYHKTDASQIYFSLGPTINNYEGEVDNFNNRNYIDSDFISLDSFGADFSVMVRNKLNDNLYYNIGGRINIVSVSDLIVNLGAFVSITYKLI